MFFRRSTKVDRKIRFQHVAFKRELETRARRFKREKKSSSTRFVWLSRKRVFIFFIVLVVCTGAYYVTHVSNVLFVRDIVVHGQTPDMNSRAYVNEFLDTRVAFVLPRRNMLFLSEVAVKDFLLSRDDRVYEIPHIVKNWTKRILEITVIPRTKSYVLETSSGETFTAANDGKVLGHEEAVDEKLPKIIVDKRPVPGELYFTNEQLRTLEIIQQQFSTLLNIAITAVDMSGYQRQDLIGKGINLSNQDFIVTTEPVVEKKYPSLMLFFDSYSDIGLAVENLRLLLASTSIERLENVAYIDMRFKGKSYLCLKASVCEQPLPPPPEPVVPIGETLQGAE